MAIAAFNAGLLAAVISPVSMRATLMAVPPLNSADGTIPDLASESAAPRAAPDITRAAGALAAPLTASSMLVNTSP